MKELICFDQYGNELNEWMEVPDESEQESLHFTRKIISQFFEKEKELRGLSGKERSVYELKYNFELQYYKPVYKDFSLFEKNGKWGLKSNVFGLVTLAPIYDEVQFLYTDCPFTSTDCKVRLGNKYGYACPDKIQIPQAAGNVVWYPHIFKNFPQFVVIYTVKGFGGNQ